MHIKASKMERSRVWESAKLIVTGLRKDPNKDFGIYQVYATLKDQLEAGELNKDQLRCMGLDSGLIVPQQGNPQGKGGIFIEGGV